MKIVISGHYGGMNLGDEAILAALIDGLRLISKNASITVLSHVPHETGRYTGVNAIKQPSVSFHLYRQLKQMAAALREADLIIIGGGGILQDGDNIETIPRYLLPALIGKFYGRKVAIYGVGVGPLNRRYSCSLITSIVPQADRISVRDRESRDILHNFGIKEVDLVPDPAFGVPSCSRKRVGEIFRREHVDSVRRPKIGVFLRDIYFGDRTALRAVRHKVSETQKEAISRNLTAIARQLQAQLLFLCVDDRLDLVISEEIYGRCSGDARFIRNRYLPAEYAGIIGNLDLVISMPLHPVIIASRNHVPMVAIDYYPKVRNCMKSLGLSEYLLPMEAVDQLQGKVLQLWEARDNIRNRLEREITWRQERSLGELRKILEGTGQGGQEPKPYPSLLRSAMSMGVGFLPEYLRQKLCFLSSGS